jgi:hypothetical protein
LDLSDKKTCLFITILNTWDIRNPSVMFSTLLDTPTESFTLICLIKASWEGPETNRLFMVKSAFSLCTRYSNLNADSLNHTKKSLRVIVYKHQLEDQYKINKFKQ